MKRSCGIGYDPGVSEATYDSGCIVGEGRRHLNKDAALNEGYESRCKLCALRRKTHLSDCGEAAWNLPYQSVADFRPTEMTVLFDCCIEKLLILRLAYL